MTELDLIEMLSESKTKRKIAAREFLAKIKTSGVFDTAIAYARSHPNEMKAGALGAAVAVGGQYLSNKTHASKSVADKVQAPLETEMAAAQKTGKELSFGKSLALLSSKFVSGASDVLAKHPVKSALMAAPVGALTGLAILNKLTKKIK